MAQHSSRTLKMMEDFMVLHNAGHSIPEIAKMTRVDFATIYRHLDEIAEKNGVTRESLLEVPHPNYSKRGKSKMTIYRLKGKMLHEMVKRGSTKADFCAKYQCTEDELIAQIRKILCEDVQAVNEILNDITANEKRAAKAKPKATKQNSAPKAEPEMAPAPEPVPEPAAPLTKEQQLAELKVEKEDLFRQSDEANKKYAEADKNYGRCCNQLKELEGQLQRLKAEYLEVEKVFKQTSEKCNQFLKERSNAMDERKAIAQKMAEVSLRISELTAIQLLAYEDGRIEAVDDPDFQMNEEGTDKYFNMLSCDPRCNDFRMKEVKLLARAMAIRKNAEGIARIVVTFDNEALGPIFTGIPTI